MSKKPPLELEHRCLQSILAGDDSWDWFRRIYDGYINWMLEYFGVTRDEDREDLVHDTYYKLIVNDHLIITSYFRYQREKSFSATLGRTIRWAFIDKYRSDRRWQRVYEEEYDISVAELLMAKRHRNPQEQHRYETTLHCVFEMVTRRARSKIAYRILYLRFIEELPVYEVAGRLGLPENRVAKMLGHYMKRIKKTYGCRENLEELVYGRRGEN